MVGPPTAARRNYPENPCRRPARCARSRPPNDVAEEVQVASCQLFTIVVLLGECSSAAAQLSAQVRIAAQSTDRVCELIATLGLDHQRTAGARQDLARFAADGADDRATSGENLEQLR